VLPFYDCAVVVLNGSFCLSTISVIGTGQVKASKLSHAQFGCPRGYFLALGQHSSKLYLKDCYQKKLSRGRKVFWSVCAATPCLRLR
jgi:hypothetical protein